MTALPALAQETYVVAPGDTLVALAERYGTTVEAILAANNLVGTDLLAGATLTLPGAETYVVQPGDTLSDVALTTGVPVEELMALNGMSDTALTIGQELVTGGAAPDSPLTLTVEAGDSLWSIALAHPDGESVDRRWRAIWRANRDVVGHDPDLILPGQALRLPDDHPGSREDRGGHDADGAR